MKADPSRGDRFISAGTKVRLDSFVNDDDKATSEYDVVVHCWEDQQVGFYDCYVAFFGDAIPSGQPADKPYVLRYAATSLTTIE